MADQYLAYGDDGRDTLKEATVTSTGAPQAGKIPGLDAGGKLDLSLFPSSVLTDNVKELQASEALTAGKFVNIFNDAGTFKMRLADATNDRRAHGFVRAAVAMNATGKAYFEGDNNQVAGLVPGRCWLGAAGAVTQTAPKKVNGFLIAQFVGPAISATELDVQLADEIVL